MCNTNIQYIGKIDRKKFKKITNNITTDEVILTNVQIQHIKKRHPYDYENYYKYIKRIIETPDYILKDKYPNTAILIKKFDKQNSSFQIVLRLHTSIDPNEYKNSIITFWKIGINKYKQYVRNKEIVYKSIDIKE